MRGRALILGGGGMLAREMAPALAARGWSVDLAPRTECDVRDADAVSARVALAELVVNCAAYTAVDGAEREPALALEINSGGAANVARAAASRNATLVHVSTNAVFDGRLDRPYEEGDEPCPQGAYARSKHEGEREVTASGARAYVVRTGNLYGDGPNFFGAILTRARAGRPSDVVTTQRVSPTWTRELARQVSRLLDDGPPGLYHAVADDSTTPYAAAVHALARVGLSSDLARPVERAGEAWPAPRPANGVLAHRALDRLGIYCMRRWDDALDEWLDEGRP